MGLAQPKTAFGLICTILARRWRSNMGPLTVMSCDNLPMNGSVCRNATLEFANLVDKILGTWIADHVPFPSSMVDRITPVTKPEHVALLEDEYGARDGWPVIAEPFLQWVTVPNSNLQLDFNVSVRECFDATSSAVLRELDERAIDSSKNQPNRLRFDRAREFSRLVRTTQTSG